jgi:hydrogenase maturation protein HypF
MARARVELRLRGVVQGVGLRPWAAREARRRGLAGFARNDADGMRCALEGEPEAIEAWLRALRRRPPPGARIESVERSAARVQGARGFRLLASATRAAGRATPIPPDVPACRDCVEELFDPDDRRHRYAFTHCAVCGPRASVLRGLPFDRERTSLAPFPPCAACRREYADPESRRFHAQTIACPACGPRLRALLPDGSALRGDPVELAAARLRERAIVALKGYGGYHLCVDACSAAAVARLRKRKGRPAKPFALLVPDRGVAQRLASFTEHELALLSGSERAVVIAPRRAEACAALGLADEVAPGSDELGLLLPVAPLHWLLLHAPGSRPGEAAPRFPALVFTSANLSGEPTEHDDDEVRRRLAEIADLLVAHDRVVTQFCDDPVFRASPRGPIPIRLSRGTTPRRFPLPARLTATPPLLALGGDLKCAPALLAHGEIALAAHVGDLEAVRASDALEERARALARLLRVSPRLVVHDLHPGYFGSALAARLGQATLAVQHHHAHAAAALVEHGLDGPVLALALDGAGWGPDGTLWGGELLRVTLADCERLAHLEVVPLAGGERAVREPWRMAAVWLARAFPEDDAPRLPWHGRHDAEACRRVLWAAEHGPVSPATSSCGRLFDAAASLLDCGDQVSYEGEAAQRLETLAHRALDDASEDPEEIREPQPVIPAADLLRRLAVERAEAVAPARLARRFHLRLAARLAAAALAAGRLRGLSRVVLTGGCFQNRLLLEAVCARLEAGGFEALLHRRLPPNDGGLAVGQAAVAAARLARGAAG